jgi:hypothetical protein
MTIVVTLLVSCNDSVTQAGSKDKNIGTNAQISECGGFQAEHKHARTQEVSCSDERLIWRYDQDSHIVYFLNQDVWLNCCGEHTITVSFEKDSGGYAIREIDAPESGLRCHCMCFFDFRIELPDIPPGTISVQLYRHVTDEGRQWLLWQGILDLNQGNGDELIREDVGWCQ